MEIVNKLWNLCNTLRHDGVDSSDYVEQLTYLLFLKLAEEKDIKIPENCKWQTFDNVVDENLISHLETVLKELQNQKGILGEIFKEPITRINKPSSLRKIIKLLDDINWSIYEEDIIGLAFEELLGKVANDGKKGAGQYFTPRPLIQTIVDVMKPNPLEKSDFTISDVASGTAGFLIVAHEWQKEFNKTKKLTVKDKTRIKKNTYYGQELVVRPRRLALMNMFLHGVEANIKYGDSIYEPLDEKRFTVVLTNPPFGTKGSTQSPDRKDFTVKTNDKQLNFIQHVVSVLEDKGRAAIVLPDSVLSDAKAAKIWENIMPNCNLHTIIKLPSGTFAAYAAGVNAVVVFLQKGTPTENVWIFDARTNVENITKRDRPLSERHFEEFIKSYGQEPNGTSERIASERFRKFTISEIKEKNYNLDFRWMHLIREGVDLSQFKSSKEVYRSMLDDYKKALEILEGYYERML